MFTFLKFIRQRPIFLASIVLILAGLAYHFWPRGGMPPQEAFLVEVETVARGPISKTINFLAHVSSVREATLASDMKGTLKAIYVEEGKPVAKGTLLAELDNKEVEREHDLAQDKVKNAESQYARAQKLLASDIGSQAKLEVAHDNLLRARIELEQVHNRLTKSQFIAPFDGICGVFKFRPGQTVLQGDTVVSMYDPSGFVLSIDIPEALLRHVQPGQVIHYKDQESKVLSVQHSLDPDSHMGLARAEVPANWQLASGQLITVAIDVESKEGVLSLPRSAVFVKNDKSFVYVIKDGQAAMEMVEPGLVGKQRVEIIDGIHEGDKVVLKGQENIWPTRPLKEYVPKE